MKRLTPLEEALKAVEIEAQNQSQEYARKVLHQAQIRIGVALIKLDAPDEILREMVKTINALIVEHGLDIL